MIISVAALKSHLFAFFSANSFAISSSLSMRREATMVIIFSHSTFKDRTDESASVTVPET